MINFSVTWNNCFIDFRSWLLVNRRFSKLSPPRWTAAWSVIFMKIPIQRCSRRGHSTHLLDFGHKFALRSNELSPCEALLHGDMKIMWPLSASSFNIPRISWISGRNKFPCHFFLVIAPRFRTSKFPRFILSVAAGFTAASTINPPRYASFSFPWELDDASGFEFLLAFASGFPVDALSIPGLFDAIGWFTDEEFAETVEIRFIVVGFDFATILSSSFCGMRVRVSRAERRTRCELSLWKSVLLNVVIDWLSFRGKERCPCMTITHSSIELVGKIAEKIVTQNSFDGSEHEWCNRRDRQRDCVSAWHPDNGARGACDCSWKET